MHTKKQPLQAVGRVTFIYKAPSRLKLMLLVMVLCLSMVLRDSLASPENTLVKVLFLTEELNVMLVLRLQIHKTSKETSLASQLLLLLDRLLLQDQELAQLLEDNLLLPTTKVLPLPLPETQAQINVFPPKEIFPPPKHHLRAV